MMIIELMKEVGRGKRGARDLTFEEALLAADLIVNQKASQAQIGAFLMAERIKMESVEEMEAFVEVCRKQAYRSPILQGGLDCAGPYDGRKKTFSMPHSRLPFCLQLLDCRLPFTVWHRFRPNGE